MNRFLTTNNVKVDRMEFDVVLSGKDIVHNGKNKALMLEVRGEGGTDASSP